jgi:hypothetical protein
MVQMGSRFKIVQSCSKFNLERNALHFDKLSGQAIEREALNLERNALNLEREALNIEP